MKNEYTWLFRRSDMPGFISMPTPIYVGISMHRGFMDFGNSHIASDPDFYVTIIYERDYSSLPLMLKHDAPFKLLWWEMIISAHDTSFVFGPDNVSSESINTLKPQEATMCVDLTHDNYIDP